MSIGIYPAEFGRVDLRSLPQREPQKPFNVAFIVDTKGKTSAEIANGFPVITTEQAMAPVEPEPEPTPGELFDGNIGKLGRFVGDVRLS